MTTDLVVREPLDIEKVFTKDGMSGLLQDIETQVKAHVPDISTDQGRKDIISLAYNVSRSKTLIVKTGEDSIAEHKRIVKDRMGLLKTAKEFLDNLRDETRQPVTDWEAEQERIKKEEEEAERKKVEARIEELAKVDCLISVLNVAPMSDEEFDSFLAEKTAKFEEKQKKEAIEAAEKKAEAERLALQKKEQDAKEAALKKQADELAAKEKAIQDEKDRIARKEQAKIDAENARIKAEQEAKDKAERKAKEAEEKRVAAEKEAERRKALMPDKEKIQYWLGKIENELDDAPRVEKTEAVQFIVFVRDILDDSFRTIFDELKDL